MIPFHTVFLMMVVLFALVGSLRGWAKEIIVAFSVLLAMFIEQVLISVDPIGELWMAMQPISRFWVRLIVFGLIVLFGYASPTLASRLGSKVARERLQDILLGFFIGLLNGVLIVGTIWFYLDEAKYGVETGKWSEQQVMDSSGQPIIDEQGEPVTEIIYAQDAEGVWGIQPPQKDSTAWGLMPYLPPRIITEVYLYLAVGMAFVFVIIVFI
jgi:uncharacterized membrane protein required for colicin V production